MKNYIGPCIGNFWYCILVQKSVTYTRAITVLRDLATKTRKSFAAVWKKGFVGRGRALLRSILDSRPVRPWNGICSKDRFCWRLRERFDPEGRVCEFFQHVKHGRSSASTSSTAEQPRGGPKIREVCPTLHVRGLRYSCWTVDMRWHSTVKFPLWLNLGARFFLCRALDSFCEVTLFPDANAI